MVTKKRPRLKVKIKPLGKVECGGFKTQYFEIQMTKIGG